MIKKTIDNKNYICDQEAKNWSRELRKPDRYRVWKTANIVKKLKADSLIDIGCGDGDFLTKIVSLNKLQKVAGSDFSQIRLKNAAKKLNPPAGGKTKNVKLIHASIEKLPFNNHEFDVVTVLEVLEHIPNLAKAVSEIKRICRKYLIISVPSDEKIIYEICVHCGQPTPRYGHLYSFNQNNLKKIIGKDFKLIKSEKILFKPFQIVPINNILPFFLINLIDKIANKNNLFNWQIYLFEKNN